VHVADRDVTAVAVVVGNRGYAFLGQEETDSMPNRKDPGISDSDSPIERRQQPREDANSVDWETIALRRVERHVERLSGDLDSASGVRREAGWEEAPLLALRRRIRDLKTE
jgi:hypothetical protein